MGTLTHDPSRSLSRAEPKDSGLLTLSFKLSAITVNLFPFFPFNYRDGHRWVLFWGRGGCAPRHSFNRGSSGSYFRCTNAPGWPQAPAEDRTATATLQRKPRRLAQRIGLPYSEIEQQGFHFPVTEVSCRYAHPDRYDEVVKIETKLAELDRATLTFNYRITGETDDVLLATGSTKRACVDHAGHVSRIPKILEPALATAKT